MVCRGKVLGKAGGGRGDRGRSLDRLEGRDPWKGWGRVLLEIVMMMVVMMAVNWSVGRERARDARRETYW